MRQQIISIAIILALITWNDECTAAEPVSPTKIDYNRQIRPLLSNHCFKCHGPDGAERKSGLRLDDRDAAVQGAESGKVAIVPNDSAKSELVRRVFSNDPDQVMPPPDENKPLKAQDKELLKRWIEQGAAYQSHWAFVAPRRPELPLVRNPAWTRNPIDRFILAQLESQGWQPAKEADKVTLVRRVTLDLTGLPPTPSEVDAFLADTSERAYEKVVDRLLTNPHYGERMALDWLDASRYADTNGYHIDNGRDMTLWRKWVIDAFNNNLPYDQFTIDQLAGDLVPNSTFEQKIASGFHRNHMINFEGGAVPREYHNAYVVDRVNTTGTVWMGLTIACSQCHDHKYDPVSQKEYYQLYAYFHNVPENGLDGRTGNSAPLMKFPSAEQKSQAAELTQQIGDLEKELAAVEDKKSDKYKEINAKLKETKSVSNRLEAAIPSAMVMEEMPQPRETFVLVRGQYDKNGDKVTPALPSFLPALPEGSPNNRLGLAKWLVHPSHPLTARVTVNRYWQLFFGTGLVKTAEDFGSQGELPSHPELLDWLATEFQSPATHEASSTATRTPWNVKALVKMIVMSATYRQSSKVGDIHVPSGKGDGPLVAVSPHSLDPENRLLGRGPRFRLPAEFIRDQALTISGLVNHDIGGKSVSPYQPVGLWEELMSRADGKNWTAQEYVQSHGPDLYKRTMYTFWKRTCPPPSLATFDAPDRETCVVRRARTNTPLQALVLMNDPTYVEASRKLAERIVLEGGTSTEERIVFAFRLATARRPNAKEIGVLRRLFDQQLAHFQQNAEAAQKLLTIGEAGRDEKLKPAEVAAWAMVANAILNLDETVTRG